MNELHPIEIQILKVLTKSKKPVDDIIKKSKMDQGQVRKALAWLSDKGLINVEESGEQLLSLGVNGVIALKKGLPEKRFLNLIKTEGKDIAFVRNHLSSDEFNNSMGFLKRQGFIIFLDGKVKPTSLGLEFLNQKTDEEKMLELLSERELDYHTLPKGMQETCEKLSKRKDVLVSKDYINREYSINSKGAEALDEAKDKNYIGKLTPEMLREGVSGEFRPYNITAPAPVVYPGRKHFLRDIADRVKEIFIEMGFQEMKSDYVETAFWNFDVMFFPQDHPGREVMDTYYLTNPKSGKIPSEFTDVVKEIQENGGTTGSTGHGIEWSAEVAKKLILRAHTTQTTFRILSKGLIPPYKFFSIDRVFRNETLDAHHLNEFHQIEGFVVGDGLTLRHLTAMFKKFYEKMGVKEIRFKPTYNPYTEPSMEIFGKLPGSDKWIEIGNSGIFRPETLKPMGVNVPVIAWGLALERLVPFQYDIKDIRQVLGHFVDIDSIRNSKILRRLV